MASSSGEEIYDAVVIGGGPGGYVAAIRAAQLDARVALIEKGRLGGTCAIVGCIPTKALLRTASLLHDIRRAKEFGINVGSVSPDIKAMMKRKDDVVKAVSDGVEYLLKGNGVDVIVGWGKVTARDEVSVSSGERVERVRAKSMVIATGSSPAYPPIPGIRGKGVITSEEALSLEEAPKSIIIAGGGAEGGEFACIFREFGSDVTIVEMMPHLLPTEDRELGTRLHRLLTRNGIKVNVGTKVLEIGDGGERKSVRVSTSTGESTIEGDLVLLGLGRRACSGGIGLEELGVRLDRGRIVVDERMRTSVPNIYAIGDVTGSALAHEAMEEGVVASENIMGHDSRMDHRVIPRCIYTIPEVAAVGLTEEQARAQGYDVKVGKFSLGASGRARTLGDTEGFVKFLIDGKTRTILGAHMIGPEVSELISEVALAMRVGAKIDDIRSTIHPHPTLSEVIREAVLDADKLAIHKLP